MNPVVEKVAEAIEGADLGPHKGLYNRMAEAAIEALGLTEMVESIPVRAGG